MSDYLHRGDKDVPPPRLEFLNREGEPIDVREWGRLLEDLAYRTVDTTDVVMPDERRATVRTMWLGHTNPVLSHCRLFGSAVQIHDRPLFEAGLYDTEEQALLGHAHLVTQLRGGVIPEATD
ncbi:MAG: hypothetical protein ABWY93_04825 [Mycobacterium sp.]